MTAQTPTEEQPVVELSEPECWELLGRLGIGRLAYHLVDEVHVVPVNYAVDDRDGTPTLVFLTAEGNKLLAAELRSAVALQIDELGGRSDDHVAWSVLVRGRLQHLG